MFQTKKSLKKKIAELEAEISSKKDDEQISAFINGANLPKCESLACASCEHMVFLNYHGRLAPIGCGKGVRCPDFQLTDRTAENRQLLQEALLSQRKEHCV